MKGGGLTLASLREQTDGDPREIRERVEAERRPGAVTDYAQFIERLPKVGFGLSSRPEFYSGRGPNRGDLSPDHLAAIHKALGEEHGETAALQFLRLVLELPDLSASGFLSAFFRFFTGGMVAPQVEQRTVDRLGLDGPSPTSDEEERDLYKTVHIGVLELFGGMGKRSPESWAWESAEIKVEFLERAGVRDAGRVFEGLQPGDGGGGFGARYFRGHRRFYGDE